MDSRIHKLYVSAVVGEDAICKNWDVKFDVPEDSCAGIVCDMVKEGGDYIITVTYPDSECNDCVFATLTCIDDCSVCNVTKRIEICPCSSDVDCPDCEKCDEFSKICVSRCDPDEFCKDDECVECDDSHPCPGGGECDNGKCKCPSGQKRNSKGKCVECFPDDEDLGCDRCIDGIRVPRTCDNGLYLNPETCECVECFNDLHCDKPNECCAGNDTCKCCEGYERNGDGDCVEKPECVYDEDCEDPCKVCNNNTGNCEDKVVPPGHECVDGEEKEICDCNNPQCPAGEFCHETEGSENCHCYGCEGACSVKEDCGPNCYCDDGQCKQNPCSGDCINGCSEGCGCDDDLECVPCSTFDCEKCDQVDGCKCNDGEHCLGTGCKGNCLEASDCEGDNCGCLHQKCVDCDSLTPEECAQTDGCEMNGDDCEPPKCDGPCVTGEECGQDCGCLDEECVECASIKCEDGCPDGCKCNPDTGFCKKDDCPGCDDDEDEDEDCNDELKITKGDCEATWENTTGDCCPCDDISIGIDVDNFEANEIDFVFTLKKGGFTTMGEFNALDKLGSTGIANDLPIGGYIQVYRSLTIAEWDPIEDKFTGATKVLTPTLQDGISIVGQDEVTITDVSKPQIQSEIIFAGGPWRIQSISYYYELSSNARFENECIYSKKRVKFAQIDSNDNGYSLDYAATLFKQVNCRLPLIEFYKAGDTNVFAGAPFRREYGSSITLDSIAEGLEHLKYYGIDSDCGCAEKSVYDCNGDKVADPLVFCEPTDMKYDLNNCGEQLQFTADVVVDCPIILGTNPLPTYELLLNGIVVDTKQLPGSGILYTNGQTFSLSPSAPIENVTLRIQEDECGDCDLEGDTEYEILETGIGFGDNICSSQTNFVIDYFVNGGKAPYHVQISKDGVTNPYMYDETGITEGNHETTVTYVNGGAGVYVIKVTDDDGCEVTETKTYVDLTPQDNAEIETSCVDNSINVKNVGYSTMEVKIAGQGIKTIAKGETASWIGLNPDDYTLTVTISSECSFTQNVTIDCCKSVEGVTIIPSQNGSDVIFFIQNDSSGKVKVNINDTTASSNEDLIMEAGDGSMSNSYTSSNAIVFVITSLDGTACTPVTDYYTYDPSDLCAQFDNNVSLNKGDCYDLKQVYSVLNPTGINITVKENGSGVYTGTGNYNGTLDNGSPVLILVESVDNTSCNKSMMINPDCCTSEDIEVVNEDCQGGNSTVAFNYITTAVQNSQNLSVTNNEITFNPDNGDVTVTYTGSGCNLTKTFSFQCCETSDITMTNSECSEPDVNSNRYTFDYITKATLVTGSTVNTYIPDGSGRIVIPKNLIESNSQLQVAYDDGDCSTSRVFYNLNLNCCECGPNIPQYVNDSLFTPSIYELFNNSTGTTFNIDIKIGDNVYTGNISRGVGTPVSIAQSVENWLEGIAEIDEARVTVYTGGVNPRVEILILTCNKVVNIGFDFANLPNKTYNTISCSEIPFN